LHDIVPGVTALPAAVSTSSWNGRERFALVVRQMACWSDEWRQFDARFSRWMDEENYPLIAARRGLSVWLTEGISLSTAQRITNRSAGDTISWYSTYYQPPHRSYCPTRRAPSIFLPHDATPSAVLLRQIVRPFVCDVEVSRPHEYSEKNFVA